MEVVEPDIIVKQRRCAKWGGLLLVTGFVLILPGYVYRTAVGPIRIHDLIGVFAIPYFGLQAWLGSQTGRRFVAAFVGVQAFHNAALTVVAIRAASNTPDLTAGFLLVAWCAAPAAVLTILAASIWFFRGCRDFVAAQERGNPLPWLPRSIREFLHRPEFWEGFALANQHRLDRGVTRYLTEELIDVLDDEELEDVLHDHVTWLLDERGVKLSDLRPELQAIYTTWWVEAEVDNGGLYQLFQNKGVEFVFVALESYKRMGLPHHAELMADAIEQYLKEEPEQAAIWAEAGQALDIFETYVKGRSASGMDDVDTAFYVLERADRAVYIRANQSRVVGERY